MLLAALLATPLLTAHAGTLPGIESTPHSTTARRGDVQRIGTQPSPVEEVLASFLSNLAPEAINEIAWRNQLIHLDSQRVGLLGRTIHRWKAIDGRPIPDVILALERDGGVYSQPNNIYTLQ